jgi:hypothetical protein
MRLLIAPAAAVLLPFQVVPIVIGAKTCIFMIISVTTALHSEGARRGAVAVHNATK